MVKYTYLALLTLTFGILGCTKEDETEEKKIQNPPVVPTVDTGFYITFNHVAGNDTLKEKVSYYTTTNDTIEVNTFIYYFTNVALQKEDSSWVKLPESYFLIDEDKPASKKIQLVVPKGKYVAISFLIGVDSTRNVSGAQEGALDPANGMFWTWNSGYIQTKLEGKIVSAVDPKAFIYHIGGFSGPYNPLKKVILPFTTPHEHKTTQKTTVSLEADALKWFYGANTISPVSMSVVIDPGAEARALADNYAGMFSLLSVK